MNSEITFPAAVASLIGLGVVGAMVGHVQTPSASGQAVAQTAAPVAAASGQNATAPAVPQKASDSDTGYPYAGTVFNEFVTTSYNEAPDLKRPEFHAWMQNAYAKSGVRFKGLEGTDDLDGALAAIRQRYESTTDPEAKTLLEKQTGAFCQNNKFKIITGKKTIYMK